ncbi:hypothetical protein NLI96_g11944 [Meripilus lineatus]|uniref:Uncharacterized protein n=1 Tax=Meripilus lineatus TaxID=2056292 RepID=A0AAD5Y814_9APHY|nr:hypothetical protein NLI96_g11944 [Physisporinus lineatus]
MPFLRQSVQLRDSASILPFPTTRRALFGSIQFVCARRRLCCDHLPNFVWKRFSTSIVFRGIFLLLLGGWSSADLPWSEIQAPSIILKLSSLTLVIRTNALTGHGHQGFLFHKGAILRLFVQPPTCRKARLDHTEYNIVLPLKSLILLDCFPPILLSSTFDVPPLRGSS